MSGADFSALPSILVSVYNYSKDLVSASQFTEVAEPALDFVSVDESTREHKSSSRSATTAHVAGFHSVVKRGEVNEVSKLLEEGADAASLDSSGMSPLLLATQGGHLSVVRVLLECGAADASRLQPNGPNGINALVKAAARREHLEILRALINHGADVNAVDSSGATALHCAATLGKTGAIGLLVEHGAKVDSVDAEGMTALHLASIEGRGEAIISLLRHGADIDAADASGRTPLHRACAVEDIHTTEAAELLLLWGADDTVVDNEGRTPEYYAKSRYDISRNSSGGAKQRAQESLLKLLKTTPNDRAWCRHGLVILCKARLGQGAVGTVLDRLVTLEEEELFEKSWEVDADEDDDSYEGPQQERNRALPVQQHGEGPTINREESRSKREEQPRRTFKDSQSWIVRQENKEDQSWIKPQPQKQAPETWIRPQKVEESDDTHQNRGNQPDSREFSQLYTLGKKLGEGGFAEIFGATKRGQRRGLQCSCIVKRASKRGQPHEAKDALVEEVRILRLLTHPSVVTVQEVFDQSPDYFYVVLEHLAGGPVFDHIVNKTRFGENDARHLCRTLVLCVKHCHDLGIVHRDLRPENLQLTSRGDDATIKLTGFDFARSLPRNGPNGRRGKEGLLLGETYVTAEYASPEVLRNLPIGTPTDMWSLGVIFYTILGGYNPFHDERQPRLFRRIRDGSFVFHDELWNNTSDQAKDFVGKLLVVNPGKRMTAKQALQHPWMLNSGKDLAKNDLSFNLGQLRIFHATTKLRAAIKSVMAVRRESSS